ncbi:MAG: DMT family transporter [Planctomycetota bacterium]
MSELAPTQSALAARARLAVGVLAFCCLLWGYSFPVMKFGVAALERHLRVGQSSGLSGNPEGCPTGLSGDPEGRPPLPLAYELAANGTFLGWRFLIATGLYWLLSRTHQRRFSKAELQGGLAVGATFALGMLVQIGGLRYTLPSISAFLTALAVVFAPVAQAFIFRRRVGFSTWLAIGVALAGIVVLSLPNPGAVEGVGGSLGGGAPALQAPPLPLLGEILTTLGAVLFTAQILCLDHYGKQGSAVRLTLIVLATTALLCTLLGVALGGPTIYNCTTLPALLSDSRFLWPLLSLAIFSSVLVTHLQNGYQPFISPAQACVVYCLEPVFATLFSVLFRTERLTFTTCAGGAVILAAVLLVARPKSDT